MAAGVAFVVNGCKKDESNTKTEMLTGTWTATDLIIGGQSLWSSVEACSQDDKYTFAADGSGTFDEGATKCYQDDPQTEVSNWKFIDSETKLIIDGDTSDIIQLTNSSLKLGLEESGLTGEAHYKKQ